MAEPSASSASETLRGKRIAVVGKWASMSKRDAAQWLRRQGATVLEGPDASAHWVIVGEEDLPLADADGPDQWFDADTRAAIEQGTLEVLTETQLWQRLAVVGGQPDLHRLYTPAMLAQLLGVPVAVIRRWHRRGLIVPACEVRRLPYFDFHEVAAARRLAQLLAAGVSPRQLERQLAALARLVPGVQRPLAQLSVMIEGRGILLRQGDGLIEPGGQYRFDFEGPPTAPEPAAPPPQAAVDLLADADADVASPQQMCRQAAELEESGELAAAADLYRAAMAAGGPTPEICFQLAETLYRLGDSPAARERYYMAIELDEDYVEARANLGCLLAEMGQRQLAVAAFEGAIRYHSGYADAYYHLARTLDELGRRDEAGQHWRTFLAMAPDSPWAEEARTRCNA